MPQKKKSILVLCTGGTIGMQKTVQGYAPSLGYLEKAMASMPELTNEDMPHYTVLEYPDPIDSANMDREHWWRIANDIFRHDKEYDGFVILHGTDTMAYTASALSFMLEGLQKPVILTGSQLPLFQTRNDARENLINAMWFAGQYDIPEVCVYFHNKLFRGNRVTKIDANSFAAFASPNFSALGNVASHITVRKSLVKKPAASALRVQPFKPIDIAVIRLFPGMSVSHLKAILKPPLQALILETYGLGTAPEQPDFLACVRDATIRGVVIVNCSQCLTAHVEMTHYAAGNALANAGVVSAGDMTIEATLAKLFYLFSLSLPLSEIKNQLQTDLRGELTQQRSL